MSSVAIAVFVHSTEDEERARRAVMSVLPHELRELTRFSVEIFNGHFGDHITVLRAEHKKKAAGILRYVLMSMEPASRKEFLNNIEDRIDKSGNLYIRLDKQQAFLGIIEPGDSDSVRLKLHLQGSGHDLSPQDTRRYLMDMVEKPDLQASDSGGDLLGQKVR